MNWIALEPSNLKLELVTILKRCRFEKLIAFKNDGGAESGNTGFSSSFRLLFMSTFSKILAFSDLPIHEDCIEGPITLW